MSSKVERICQKRRRRSSRFGTNEGRGWVTEWEREEKERGGKGRGREDEKETREIRETTHRRVSGADSFLFLLSCLVTHAPDGPHRPEINYHSKSPKAFYSQPLTSRSRSREEQFYCISKPSSGKRVTRRTESSPFQETGWEKQREEGERKRGGREREEEKVGAAQDINL